MYASRLIEHPVWDVCHAAEEDGMLVDRKIFEIIGFVVDNIYHKEKLWKFSWPLV